MTSRIESSPRKLKRIKKKKENQNKNEQNDTDSEPKEDLVYNFYRTIIHPMILRLSNQKDILNYCQWLTKLDTCEDPDYKLPLIKMLFISIKNNRTLKLYAEPPVDDLSELNLDSGDSTMDMLRKAQENTNEYYILANEELIQELQYKRSAAVATDLCSYIAAKTSRYLVQSFYVRSDFPIQTWHNPASITVPKNIDHNHWELYLNRFDLLMDDPALWKNELHRNTCESIMNLDQVQKELNINCIFRWHPNSLLYSVDRPKRSAGFVNIDQDISTQSTNQQQLDESAFTIVHNKSFPGYRMLSPRIYSTILMPDPDFVYNMTGVRIIHNNVSHISNAVKDKKDLETNDCRQMMPIKNDQPKSISTGSTNQQSLCSTKTIQNKNNYHKPSISTECQQINKVKTESICESNEFNNTNNRCYSKPFAISKCANNSIGSECSSKSRICELSMSSKKQNSFCPKRQIKSSMKNQSKLQNFKQFNIPSSDKSSKNDTSNFDRSTLSTDDISLVQNPGSNYSNTCENTSNNYTKQYTEGMYNLVSCIKPNNQNLPNSSRYSRQRNNQKFKNKSSNNNANNFSHSIQSQNEQCENLSTKKNTSKRQPKLKLRSISVPCNSDRTNQNDSKSKHYHKSQKDSYKIRSEFKYNDNDVLHENINKYTLSAMNKCSDRNEKISKPKYDENWNPEITDYFGFKSRKYCNGGESSPLTGKNRSLKRRTSLNNLPRNLSKFSSDDESCYSEWSAETGFNRLSSSPSYSHSSDSLKTITSDFSYIETYPGYGLDSSSSSKSSKCENSLTKYTYNVNQINKNDSISDYTNTGVRNPFGNSQKSNSSSNKEFNVNSYDLIDNIENTCLPHMSCEESRSSISLINTSHDLQDMNMPINYKTSCADDNTLIDDQ